MDRQNNGSKCVIKFLLVVVVMVVPIMLIGVVLHDGRLHFVVACTG